MSVWDDSWGTTFRRADPDVEDDRGPDVRACTWRGGDDGCGRCHDCPECFCTGQ